MNQPDPIYLGTSDTARKAREALNTMTPEDWIKDWGYVLCAALDESEHSREELVKKVATMADLGNAGIDGMRAVSDASLAWWEKVRTKNDIAKSTETPPADLKSASEDLARATMDAVLSYKGKLDVFLKISEQWGTDTASAVNPASRARASAILDELSREMATGLPSAQRNTLLRSIARVRASLGGSNVPGGGEEEPS